jgi:acetyl-CoA acetyltransferase
MGRSGKYGRLDMNKINKWGGSLSIGHPFGATGVRLAAHAYGRLQVSIAKLISDFLIGVDFLLPLGFF